MTNKPPRTGRILPSLLNPYPKPKVAEPPPDLGTDDEDDGWVEDFLRFEREEKEELERIRQSRPLGAAMQFEPRSIHSPLHTPAWKRKLRP